MSRDGRMIFVKQQGAMRTGTNLVKYALEENFINVRVMVNIGRWKHATADTPFNWTGINWEGEGRNVNISSRISRDDLDAFRAAFDADNVKYAVSIRNVYSWVESYLRFISQDYEHELPVASFTAEQVTEALRRWNLLYGSYLPLAADKSRTIFFRFEELLTDFAASLDRARLLWGLIPRHERYVEPVRYLEAGIDGQSRSELLEQFRSFDRSRHLQDLNSRFARFDSSLLEVIRGAVDHSLLRAYGYEVIEP